MLLGMGGALGALKEEDCARLAHTVGVSSSPSRSSRSIDEKSWSWRKELLAEVMLESKDFGEDGVVCSMVVRVEGLS